MIWAVQVQSSVTETVSGSDDNRRVVYDKNGVDRTLIRSSLRKTPTECLEILEDLHFFVQNARRVR
jgi:hypothetical protein